jgi:hypothetical protein
MAKKIKKFDRKKAYNGASLFRSFMDHVFNRDSTQESVRLDLVKAFNRSIKWALNKGKIIRKPVRVIAVNDMDDSIVRYARKVMDATQSSMSGFEQPAQLLWTTLNPTVQIMKALGDKQYAKRRKMNEQAEVDFAILAEFVTPAYDKHVLGKPINDMLNDVMRYLIDLSTFDGGIYIADMLDSDHGPLFPTPVMGIAKEIRTKDFKIDRKIRSGYGIGMLNKGDLKWLEIEYDGNQLPVYIQKHAIDRLIERTAPISDSNSAIYMMVCDSVSEPAICSRSHDGFLLECRSHDRKLGYFGCVVMHNAILITTFLFLTMDGTPEGERLWQKLRLRRQDKEYLGLDNLRTFVSSDIRSDVALSRLLGECSCGHLLKIDDSNSIMVSGVAEDIRNYLSSNEKIPVSVISTDLSSVLG